ncbi:MFS transporter [Paenibacillus psychroresistens]|uniref:MFS transporter n=1 Tax=Paenibacillus psychroresistens TaxID=1778678 RepID=A0A6B8RNQ3_9BACL|nr:MFS transporter [Paenibacillus psychroresistens]QGQ96996.1 MFS transporter [Paenibacillus psychroresistens]
MNRQMVTIMLLLMTVFIGFGIIIPILPAMVESTGGAQFHLALLLSLYSAASFFMSPVWGSLSDKIGRKPILLIGLCGFGISFFIFGISGGHLFWMYTSRIFGGFFSGAVTACAVAYVADITTEENRTKGMGLVGMAIGLGFIFGPPIGGLLSLVSLELPFYVASFLSFSLVVLAARMLVESLPKSKRTLATAEKVSRWIAFSGAIKYLYLLSFFVSFSLAGLEATFQYFQIKQIGATPFEVSMMFLASGIVGAVIQGGVVRKRIKKGGEMKAILIGLILSSAGFFLILASNSVLTAAIYMSVFGAGNALIRPCVISLITQRTTVGQGVATGLNSSMDSLGRILGPLVGLGLYGVTISLPFLFSGLLSLAAIYLLIRYISAEAKRRAHEKAGLNY